MSVEDSIARLRAIHDERMKLQGQLAVLKSEADGIGQLIGCAECKKEGFFAAPGYQENLPAGWVMSGCDNGTCVKCWAFWCAEHAGLLEQFECASCHCP